MLSQALLPLYLLDNLHNPVAFLVYNRHNSQYLFHQHYHPVSLLCIRLLSLLLVQARFLFPALQSSRCKILQNNQLTHQQCNHTVDLHVFHQFNQLIGLLLSPLCNQRKSQPPRQHTYLLRFLPIHPLYYPLRIQLLIQVSVHLSSHHWILVQYQALNRLWSLLLIPVQIHPLCLHRIPAYHQVEYRPPNLA